MRRDQPLRAAPRALTARSRGQSLIEFAFLAPVMMLLVFGMIDLGRGFYYQTVVTDAARDAARVLIAPAPEGASTDTDTTPGCLEETSCDTDDNFGPGFTTVCQEAQRDLHNFGVANVSCQPWTAPLPISYAQPAQDQAIVYIWCNTQTPSTDCATPNASGADCSGATGPTYAPHLCVSVGIAYTFSVLSPQIQQIGGPTLLITDSASMVTLW